MYACVCVCVTMQASEYAVVFCIVCGFMSQSTAILMPNRSVPISTLFFLDKLHKLDNQFCLFDLILYVPSTLFQLYRGGSSYVEQILTLPPTYLYCEFAFRAHFQCVVRTYDLKCVENANQLVSTQGKIMNIHRIREAYLEKSILKLVDSVIGKSNLKLEICFIILRKTILFLTSMFYFAINPFKRILSFIQ